MHVSWIPKVSPPSLAVLWLTCHGTAWLKPHRWLNSLCPHCVRHLWRAGAPWGCGGPRPHDSSRPHRHSDFGGSCAEVLCGPGLTLGRGADWPYPKFMWLQVLLPKTCSDTWQNLFSTQGIAPGQLSIHVECAACGQSLQHFHPSGGWFWEGFWGLSQVLFNWRDSSRCPQKQPPQFTSDQLFPPLRLLLPLHHFCPLGLPPSYAACTRVLVSDFLGHPDWSRCRLIRTSTFEWEWISTQQEAPAQAGSRVRRKQSKAQTDPEPCQNPARESLSSPGSLSEGSVCQRWLFFLDCILFLGPF